MVNGSYLGRDYGRSVRDSAATEFEESELDPAESVADQQPVKQTKSPRNKAKHAPFIAHSFPHFLLETEQIH